MYMVDVLFFVFKKKPAYDMRSRDWSSDGCSSDLAQNGEGRRLFAALLFREELGEGFENAANAATLKTDGLPVVMILNQRKEHLGKHCAAGIERAEQIGRASCRARV